MNAARHDLGASAGGAGPGAGAARAPGGSGAGREEATHKARLHVSLERAPAQESARARCMRVMCAWQAIRTCV